MMKKVLAVIMAAALLFALALPASAKEFSDVQESDWYYGAVNRWSDLGVINGYEDGSFKPGNPIKRSEFAKILVTVFKAPESTVNPFTDVDVSKWDGPYVLSAYAAGWMNGETTTKFNRNGYLTREAGFAVFRRALGIPALSAAEADEVLAAFSDGSKTDDWAKGEVAALVKAGYVSGDGKTLKPLDNLTRAELVVLLDKLTGNSYNSTTRAYDDNKLYITEEGDYEVKDPNAIVIIATKDPVTLTGGANRVIVAPGAEGGQLNLEDGDYGDVVVQAEKYSVASQPGSTVENVVNEDGENVTLFFTVSFDWNIKDDPKSETAYVKDGEKVGSERIFPTTRDGYTFDGWFTTEEKVDGEIAFDFDTAIDQSYTLYAHWTEDSVEPTPSTEPTTAPTTEPTTEPTTAPELTESVTFVDEDGTELKVIEKVKVGEVIPADQIPSTEKAEYEFDGWYVNGSKVDLSTYKVAVSGSTGVVITGKWNIISYTVTFDSDGGSAVKEQKVDSGKTATEPEAPKLEGKAFMGWYDGENEFDFATAITKDITLKAKWQDAEYHVLTFVSADGITLAANSGYTTPSRVLVGTKFTLPKANQVAVTGKALKAWNVKFGSDPIGETYAPGDEIKVLDDMVYSPISADAKTVSFRLDIAAADVTDATSPFAKQTVGVGGLIAAPAKDPTRAGYVFAGWKQLLTESTVADDFWDFDADTVKDNMSLVAQWEGVTTTVVPVEADTVRDFTLNGKDAVELGADLVNVKADFTAVGGTGTVNSEDYVTTLAVLAPEAEGLTVSKYEIGVAMTKEDAEGLGDEANALDEVYADYDAGEIVEGALISIDFKAGKYYYPDASEFETVEGWAAGDADKPVYVAIKFLYANNDVSDVYVIRLAHPKADEMTTVSLALGGGSFVDEKGRAVTVPTSYWVKKDLYAIEAEPVDADNAFDGWKVEIGGTEIKANDEGKYDIYDDATVTAQWTDGEKITYANGAAIADYVDGKIENVTVLKGDKYTLPENPFSIKGKKFTGWQVTAVGTTNKSVFDGKYIAVNDVLQPGDEIIVNDTLTLTAQWDAGVTVSYEAGTAGTALILGEKEDETLAKKAEFTVPESPYSAKGYRFIGWKVGIADNVDNDVVCDGAYLAHGSVKPAGTKLTLGVKNITLTAQWGKLLAVTIEKGNNAAASAEDTATEAIYCDGDEYVLPAADTFAAKDGYTFAGWTVSDLVAKKADNTAPATAQEPGTKLYVKASATAPKITATWNKLLAVEIKKGDGAAATEEDDETDEIYALGDEYTLPENPFKAAAGYKFAGWKVTGLSATKGGDAIAVTEVVEAGTKVYMQNSSTNATITAVWDTLVKVTFAHGTNATGEMAGVDVVAGEKYTLPEPTFTPNAGYEFEGWTVGADTAKYEAGAKVTISTASTVTANWKRQNGIVLKANRGATDTEETFVAVTGTTGTLPANTFTYEGYEFAGWCEEQVVVTNSKELQKVGAPVTITDGTHSTFFAIWKPVVSFGQGTPVMGDLIAAENSDKVPVVTATKDAALSAQYEMDTYKLASSSVVPYTTGNDGFAGSGSSLASGNYVAIVMTLPKDYVAATGDKLQITGKTAGTVYNLADAIDENPYSGKPIAGQITLVGRVTDILTDTTLSAAQKNIFKVHFTWANGTETYILLNAADLTIEKPVKISFNANDGGSGDVVGNTLDATGLAASENAMTYYVNRTAEQKLVKNGFTRTGYNFKGWATTATGAVKYADEAVITDITKDTTLYAVWAPAYTVTYVATGTNGSLNTVPAVQTVEGNSQITLAAASIATPAENYVFDKWDVNGVKLDAGATVTITATTTITPTFKLATA